jgi:hypothetical protein
MKAWWLHNRVDRMDTELVDKLFICEKQTQTQRVTGYARSGNTSSINWGRVNQMPPTYSPQPPN